MIRWLPIITVSLFLGLVIGSNAQEDLRTFSSSLLEKNPDLVRCAYEVNRNEWEQFRTEDGGFELFFPKTFSMKETKDGFELHPALGSYPEIHFQKLRERLSSVMSDTPYQFAGYKVQDRQNLVLASPYFSEDMDTVTSSYLFVRDFELTAKNQPVVMIRADIRDTSKNTDFEKARNQNITDIESVLTPAEQILSTFRFLTYEELYGPAGFTGTSH